MAWSLIGKISVLTAAVAVTAASPSKIGDTYEITNSRESSIQGPNGSSRGSSDVDAVIERVLAIRPDGLELEYDLPKNASVDERRSQWQLPARVLRPFSGPTQLLNRAELERRVDPWLASGNLTRVVCGHLTFTWNAFRIDCDPQSAIRVVDAFDLRSIEAHDGGLYRDARAKGPVRLGRTALRADGSTYVAVAELDPNIVRRERAETDVSVGDVLRKPVSLDAALRTHAADTVSGTISVTLDADTDGQVRQRTKVTRYTMTSGKGTETGTVMETLTRRRLP